MINFIWLLKYGIHIHIYTHAYKHLIKYNNINVLVAS